MPGPLWGTGGSAPPKGRRPKCGGLLCPPGASAPYGGPEASAPPSRRGGPGGCGVDGVRRVPPLEVFLPLGCIDRVCESLCQRERMIVTRDGKEGGEPSAGLLRDFVDAVQPLTFNSSILTLNVKRTPTSERKRQRVSRARESRTVHECPPRYATRVSIARFAVGCEHGTRPCPLRVDVRTSDAQRA